MDRLRRILENPAFRRYALWAGWIVLLAAAMVLVAALSAYFTVRRSVSGRDVAVPDLTRLTVQEAQEALSRVGLLIEQVAERNDDRIEAGQILAQEPPPGSVIKRGRKVKVVVSLGDRVDAAPELRGTAARRAQITLQQQGLRIGREVYVFSRRVPEDMVIAQDPPPETARQPGSRVDLLVSRGTRPRAFVMPDFTGRREAEVVAFLARSGLRTAPARHDPGRPGPAGLVVAQAPEAGYPVRAGDLITLTVSGEGGSGG